MLNISGIQEGVVLDHIQAGKSMDIYRYLRLGELDCTVAIIKNAKSNKMGRKDIIKIEGPLRHHRPRYSRLHRPQHHRQHHPR